MASQSTGIQQLLAAEKKSAEKVAEARKRMLMFSIYANGVCVVFGLLEIHNYFY